jgi:hypothetical protein
MEPPLIHLFGRLWFMVVVRSRGLKRKAVLGIWLFGLLAATLWLSVSAQTGDAIKEAALQLWPEYDDPGLLVIYSGTFTDSAEFPRRVAFPVPQGVRGIQATADDPAQGLLNQPWQLIDGSLAYTLPLPGFHVEYYLDRPPSGNQRDISYAFEVPYATDALTVTIQQPARSDGFSLTPQPQSSYVGANGLTHYVIRRENLRAGDKLDFRIRYAKSDNGLSATKSAPTASRPQSTLLPWLLIALGALALLGAGLYWVLLPRRGAKTATAQAKVSPPKSSDQRPPPTATDVGAGYCTQCGRRLAPSNRFCANCGAPRRA